MARADVERLLTALGWGWDVGLSLLLDEQLLLEEASSS
jgi:hypothetical protein